MLFIKTRLLKLIALLSNGGPKINTIPTAAVLFRRKNPVLILDEVDRLRNSDKEHFGEVIAVLDKGFESDAVVERTERKGGEFVVKEYPVYGPKALAGIESLADTLSDRSFMVIMRRTKKRMPRLSVRRLREICKRIQAEIGAWAIQHKDEVRNAYESLPDEIPALRDFDDRFQDIAEPLVVIGAIADAEMEKQPSVLARLKDALEEAFGQREPSGREAAFIEFLELANGLLGDAEKVFIPSKELLAACQGVEGISFIETPRGLSNFLSRFDLKPRQNAAGTVRGYELTRGWIASWISVYPLSGGFKVSEPSEPHNIKGENADFQSVSEALF